MIKLTVGVALAALVAMPAFAQMTPENNGVNELNTRGTLATAPSYHGGIPAPSPYDEAEWGAAHPDANGLNDQPKNGHDGGA